VHARVILNVVLIGVWALRLGLHIGLRHKGEDFRYVEMRSNWMKHGIAAYYILAFTNVFMLQGFFSLVVNSASLYSTIYTGSNSLLWPDYLGLAIWVVGFTVEVVGDEQLKWHIKDQTPGKKKFITWGLWRYTRHPNYFGEAVLWWGIWIIACGCKWGWITVYSPICITLLVRFLSGVPMLEKKYEGREDWKQYCFETNVFVPWFYKKQPPTVEKELSAYQEQKDMAEI